MSKAVELIRQLGHATVERIWRLGFAARFLWVVLLYSGASFRRLPLTLREIYFSGVLSLLIILVSGLFVGLVLGLQGYEILQRFGSTEALGTLVALVATVLPCLITLSIISYCYDFFIQNLYIKMILRAMQCGATALIVNVGIDLLVKQGKKKLILPMLIIIGTFIANLFFDTNIMVLILIDGIIGLLFMRAAQYN